MSLTRSISHVLLTLLLGLSSIGWREGVCIPLLGLGRAFRSVLDIRTWLKWWFTTSVSLAWLSLSLGIQPPCHKEAQTTGGSHLWVCIKHVFSSDVLLPGALLSMAVGEGGLPLPDQPILIDSKQCTCELAFRSKPINLEAIPPRLYGAPGH